MRRLLFLLIGATVSPAWGAEPTLYGVSGLLTVPSAEPISQGNATFGYGRTNPRPDRLVDVDSYYLGFGFADGLELSGRVIDDATITPDLSLDAKYRFNTSQNELSVAVGAIDVGGDFQLTRSVYAVATFPWQPLILTAGYGAGPDIFDGALAGIEYRPARFIGFLAEYDTKDVNAGLRLTSDPIWGGLRAGVTVGYRGGTEEVEYGAHIEFPLGRRETEMKAAPAMPVSPSSSSLQERLTSLGFESVVTGTRPGNVQAVVLENRRYNHSSADGVGLALGVIANEVDPLVQSIELTLLTYGIPQTTITVPAETYRAYLRDPSNSAPLSQALKVRGVSDTEPDTHWDSPLPPLKSVELIIEPYVRTYVATEFGALDYGLAARPRMVAPLGYGLIANVAGEIPLARSDDLAPGENFASTAPEAGVDLALGQYLLKLSPQWNWLLSAGRTSVYRADQTTLGLEQAWTSEQGSHQVRVKLVGMKAKDVTHKVAIAGYTWFDPVLDYSVSVSGGRYYAGDSGVRVDFNRYFGDTICGLFYKFASPDDQAAGVQVSLPLTPRQDSYPGMFQLKGSDRWYHSLGTTLNGVGKINALRPLLMYEPNLDLDLRRDVLDAGRLNEVYLRDELPRMREAYELWGTSPLP